MDPIGTISTILSLAERIANYIQDVKGAKEERRRLLFEVTALQILLPMLRKRISHVHSLENQILSTDLKSILSGPLLQCNIALEHLAMELTPAEGVHKLLWPFAKNGIADKLVQIERLKTYAILALQDGLSAMTEAIQKDLECMDRNIENFIVNQRKDSDRLIEVANMTTELKSNCEYKGRQELAYWISPLCFTEQQCAALKRRTKGTGTWVLRSPQFQDWMADKFRVLWCPGNPGVGKTILTSIVINYLQELSMVKNDSLVLYIYCNYKAQLEDAIELLEALLRQLVLHRTCLLAADTIKKLQCYKDEGRRPSLDMITSILVSEFSSYSRAFIVVDALDEIPNPMRSKLLEELRSLTVRSSAKLMGTSRNITSVGHDMHSDKTLEIQTNEQDLKAHVAARIIGDQKLDRLINKEPSIQDEVVSKVVEKAQGMFLLARLHMDALSAQLNRNEILKALDVLPKAFEDTYDEAIKRIDQQSEPSKFLAYRVLSWISYATRPMSLQELQYALVVREGTTGIDPNDLYDQKDLLSVCAGLVSVGEKSHKVRLVHYTAQQYLERVRIKGHPFLSPSDLSMSCLTYLSFNWFGPITALLSQHPFLQYAAEAWGVHARTGDEPKTVDYAFTIMSNEEKVSLLGSMMLGGRQRERNPTGLHVCSYFGLTNVVQRLLNCGRAVDVDARDRNGRSPLHWAAGYGNEGIVNLLLDTGGVEIDAKDDHDWTPLSWAAGRGHNGVTKILLERGGIDVDARDISGRTTLSWAAERGYNGPLKMLIDTHKVDVNASDERGRTPLSWAAGYGQVGAVKLLLKTFIVDVDAKDNHDWTPLSWAAGRGHDEVVKLLLATGSVDVNTRDEHGRTSLSWAAERGYERSMKLLLAVKAIDIGLVDNEGRSPISYATENGHDSIMKLILDRGKLEVDPPEKALGRRRTQ